MCNELHRISNNTGFFLPEIQTCLGGGGGIVESKVYGLIVGGEISFGFIASKNCLILYLF